MSILLHRSNLKISTRYSSQLLHFANRKIQYSKEIDINSLIPEKNSPRIKTNWNQPPPPIQEPEIEIESESEPANINLSY